MTEPEVKLAAIREWLLKEHEQMPYVSIVHGIRAVLDWSIDTQKRDADIINAVREERKRPAQGSK